MRPWSHIYPITRKTIAVSSLASTTTPPSWHTLNSHSISVHLRESWGNSQATLSTQLHALDTNVPPLDHFAHTDLELERLVAITAAVELLAADLVEVTFENTKQD